MTKNEFVKAVAEGSGITQKVVRDVLNVIQDVAYQAAKDEDSVSIINGLTLTSVVKEARVGRNPSTGEPVDIPEKRVPKVKVGLALKRAVAY